MPCNQLNRLLDTLPVFLGLVPAAGAGRMRQGHDPTPIYQLLSAYDLLQAESCWEEQANRQPADEDD